MLPSVLMAADVLGALCLAAHNPAMLGIRHALKILVVFSSSSHLVYVSSHKRTER